MAKSYFVLETKKKRGTESSDSVWDVSLTKNHITENVADLFYEYLESSLGTISYFKVKDVLNDLKSAKNNNSRNVALGILISKVGGKEVLGGYVDSAWKALNDDLLLDVQNGRSGYSTDEYNAFYKGVTIKPENSHLVYAKEKDYAVSQGIDLKPYKKSSVTTNNEEIPLENTTNGTDNNGTDNNGTAPNNEHVVEESNNSQSQQTTNSTQPEQATNNEQAQTTSQTNNGEQPQNTNTNPGETPTPVAGNNETASQRAKLTPAESKAAGKYNRVSNFFGRHSALLTITVLALGIVGSAFIPSTFFATSVMSLMVLAGVGWLTSFLVMTVTPVKHAKRRSKLREKISKDCVSTNKMLNSFNSDFNSMEMSARGNHNSQARESAYRGRQNLQNAVNRLNSALTHQEELYDIIKQRRIRFTDNGKYGKARKLENMPVAIKNFISTFVRCELAVREYNDKIDSINERFNLDIQKETLTNWNELKEKVYRYYPNELNEYYERFGYTRDQGEEECPRRVSSTGEALRVYDFEAERQEPVAPNSEIEPENVTESTAEHTATATSENNEEFTDLP